MGQGINTFLLVMAAIFPVVNPPGTALVFLALTQRAAPALRRELAWRVAKNSFAVLVGSLYGGALILQFYGISIPVLRVAGGFVVAVAGWRLLHEGSHKDVGNSNDSDVEPNLVDRAFYPLTLPLTTGPGTIAVVISIGLSHPVFTNTADQIIFFVASLLAIGVIAGVRLFLIRLCRSRSKSSRPGGDRHRGAAVRIHPVLPGRTNSLVRRERTFEICDFVTPNSLRRSSGEVADQAWP